MTRTLERPIALVGLMGAGKTATAQALGERMGVSIADLDAMIEAEEGCSVAELFRLQGEAAFRRREGELLRRVLASGVRVVACGGGVVLDPAHRELLRRSCRVVWIEVSPEIAALRIGAGAASRPMLAAGPPAPQLAALLEQRRALYAEVAELRVDSDGRTAEEVAASIETALAGARR